MIVEQLLSRFGRTYCQAASQRDFRLRKRKLRKPINERLVEYSFALRCLANLPVKTVLDVGTGRTAFPCVLQTCGYAVTATDNVTDYWRKGMFNRHCMVIDDDITKTSLTDQFDFVTCISVIEHIHANTDAVLNMFNLLKPGGHCLLTFPYNDNQHIPNAYDLPDASYGKRAGFVTQIYSRNELNCWLEKSGGTIVEQEYWEAFSGQYWACGDRLAPPRRVSRDEHHHLTCVLIRKAS